MPNEVNWETVAISVIATIVASVCTYLIIRGIEYGIWYQQQA